MAVVAFKQKKVEELAERQYAALRSRDTKLVGPKGDVRVLPLSLHRFLKEVTGQLTLGKSITLVRGDATVTPAKAAGLLGISRQALGSLLDQGEIAFRKTGAQRNIRAQDLFRYQAKRNRHRQRLMRDLARAEAEEGIYDLIPPGGG